MYFVFKQLTVNLLSVNLWYISCNVALTQRHISFTDFPGINYVASSAYKTDLTPQSRNTSLIYIRNNNGSSIEPWGTPCIIYRG